MNILGCHDTLRQKASQGTSDEQFDPPSEDFRSRYWPVGRLGP